MQRLKRRQGDRGAVAVWVAVLMVPLMVVAALAIDISAVNADRQRLQTGADAAALAVAQDCARGECTAAVTAASANQMAAANAPFGGANAPEFLQLDPVAGRVEVRTSSEHDYLFAPIIGEAGARPSARSAARWGYPTGGTAVMPLAFSYCQIWRQTGVTEVKDATGRIIGLNIPAGMAPVTLYSAGSTSAKSGCAGPSGNLVPGGFGWLAPTGACSATTTQIGVLQPTSPGNSPSNTCLPSDFNSWIGRTTLLPVYDYVYDTGNNAQYRVFGYIAFKLKEYYFAGSFTSPDGSDPCSGSDRCIVGSFERFVDLEAAFSFSPAGPPMGAAMVAMELPGATP
jgi:Flp pilus assembly protein TadG